MNRVVFTPITALLLLSGASVTAQPARTGPKAGPDKATQTAGADRVMIPLYLSSKRALVMLRVGDYPPVPVVFDTGTNGNLIDLGLAGRLGLPKTGPSPSIDGSTGKPVPGYDTFITGARLGGILIADARATAITYNQPDEVGIFGPNSFSGSLVCLDGPRSRLIIQPKSGQTIPSGPPIPYLGEGGAALPSAVLDFGGIKVTAILDSGNDSPIILPMIYKDTLSLEAAPVQIGFAVSAAGRQPIYRAWLRGGVRVAGVKLDRPEVYFMEGSRPNIGLPILRQLKVVFDPAGSRDWVLPAEVSPPESPGPR